MGWTHHGFPVGTWTDVGASFDGTTKQLEVGIIGADTATTTCAGTAWSGPLPLWIGGDPAKGPRGRPFSGYILRVGVQADPTPSGTATAEARFELTNSGGSGSGTGAAASLRMVRE